jgi:predicted ferric reductase
MLVSVLIESLLPPLIPKEIDSAYDVWFQSHELGAFFPVLILAVLSLVVWLVSAVGLFLYKSWARPLALAYIVMMLVVLLSIGPSVQSSWNAALNFTAVLSWGAAVALSYSSEFRERFSRVKAN